ncbi:MAG TPA: transglutaminase-like domain-containing protein [Steroidobacteraceae bacterium]|nr:transglutaminase-like domain-containing protein [Steroidobacteraceae bacterium]
MPTIESMARPMAIPMSIPMAMIMLLAMLIAAPAHAADERWQVVRAEQTKVGHVRIVRSENGATIFDSEQLEIRLGRQGRRVLYRVRLDTESGSDGSLRRIAREVEASEGHSRVEAMVAGDDLEVSHGPGRMRTTQRLAGAARGLKSDEFARAWLASVGRGEKPAPLRFRTWDPVKIEVVDVELAVSDRLSGAGVERRVYSSRATTGSLLRVDAAGNVVHERMSLGAFTLERADAPRPEALAPDEPFDHVAALLQPSPYRIPARDMDQKIRYRFDNHGNDVALPTGAGQRTWREDRTTWIQVCASCALDATPLSDEERQRALEPTPWLESADPQLARHARVATAGARDDAAKMRRLANYVRQHMSTQVDMLGYGTALQALRTRRGDCTEYAVLLAALGRAAGVPTRVAIGRVYARHFEGRRHVFVPHAWVQAWTGSGWQSFDAALGKFDSTHLAFAVSYDGNPQNHFAGTALSRELTLEAAARVVPRKPEAGASSGERATR